MDGGEGLSLSDEEWSSRPRPALVKPVGVAGWEAFVCLRGEACRRATRTQTMPVSWFCQGLTPRAATLDGHRCYQCLLYCRCAVSLQLSCAGLSTCCATCTWQLFRSARRSTNMARVQAAARVSVRRSERHRLACGAVGALRHERPSSRSAWRTPGGLQMQGIPSDWSRRTPGRQV